MPSRFLSTFFSLGTQERTLKEPVHFEGVGLHSGETIKMTVHPGPGGSGVVFGRQDIPQGVIPGKYDHVYQRPFCTIIENEHGASISTIEHLMAALFALQIDNVRICLDGPEVPVLDGSSLPFYTRLESVGTIEQSASKRIIRVLKPMKVETSWGFVELSPLPSFTLECEMTFSNRTSMPAQKRTYRWFDDAFHTDIAPARTFGFFEDMEALKQGGFAKGGSLENAVVMKDGKPLNAEGLRFEDECVRHKILDAIGDLYLAGALILGKYSARNGGHSLNNQILRLLFSDPANYRMETIQPENQNQWQPFTRSMIMGFSTSTLF